MAGIAGSMPYGASTLTGVDGARRPSENELAIARSRAHSVVVPIAL
jgi:NAD(P)H dehydrogenase (quinone)